MPGLVELPALPDNQLTFDLATLPLKPGDKFSTVYRSFGCGATFIDHLCGPA
jgi:hypothetical protein